MITTAGCAPETAVVLHVGGVYYAPEKAVVEQVLARQSGVLSSKPTRSRRPPP